MVLALPQDNIPSTDMIQVTRPAQECNETDRVECQLLIRTYFEPNQLVFIDESAFDSQSARQPYDWAPINGHAHR